MMMLLQESRLKCIYKESQIYLFLLSILTQAFNVKFYATMHQRQVRFVHRGSINKLLCMTEYEHLKNLDKKCADLCQCHGHLSPSNGIPNFRLLYSSAKTFKTHGGVMFLGTNPGGCAENAKEGHRRNPFEKPGWSAYLDEDWHNHALQPAAKKVAGIFAGPSESGEHVLRRSPAGNLIPFRSEKLSKLPKQLRNDGIEIGVELIRLAKPSVLVLFASNQVVWGQLMEALDRSPETTYCKRLDDSGFTFRESVGDEMPSYVFALPGVNGKVTGRNQEVIDILRRRCEKNLKQDPETSAYIIPAEP